MENFNDYLIGRFEKIADHNAILVEAIEEIFLSDNMFFEKKTREEYNKEKFKKKYNYDKKDDTITVDGHKYKVDMRNTKYLDVTDDSGETQTIAGQTSMTVNKNDPTLILDKNYFKLKNQKRRDAVLQHEVAHSKYHQQASNPKYADKDMISEKTVNACMRAILQDAKNNLSNKGYDNDEIKEIMEDNKFYFKDIKSKMMNGHYGKEPDKARVRADVMKKLRKHAKGGHSNVIEFEADRYAANKTSPKDLKKGVNDLYKYVKKDNKKLIKSYDKDGDLTKKQQKQVISSFNKQADEDKKTRAKALNDKNLTEKEKKVYS